MLSYSVAWVYYLALLFNCKIIPVVYHVATALCNVFTQFTLLAG